MKKLGLLLSFFILLTAFTCENEPLEGDFVTDDGPNATSCVDAIQNTADAANAFVQATPTNYSQLCNAYVSALEDQLAFCGDDTGAIQTLIDGLGDCNSDEEPTGIVGTWLLTAWNGEEAIDLNNDGTESINFLDEMDCYTNETIVFNQDNSGVAMSTSYADIEIFIEVGTTDSYDFNITCIEEVENTDMTWTQSGAIISITDEFGTIDWTLNGNTLSITIPDGFSVVNTEDVTIEVIQDLTFVYTKQ